MKIILSTRARVSVCVNIIHIQWHCSFQFSFHYEWQWHFLVTYSFHLSIELTHKSWSKSNMACLARLLIVANALLCRQYLVEAKRLADGLSKLPYRPFLSCARMFFLSLSPLLPTCWAERAASRCPSLSLPCALVLCFSAYSMSLSTSMLVTRDSWTYRLYLLSLSFKATTNDFRSNIFNDQEKKWNCRHLHWTSQMLSRCAHRFDPKKLIDLALTCSCLEKRIVTWTNNILILKAIFIRN